jgi:putative flippase GtrA
MSATGPKNGVRRMGANLCGANALHQFPGCTCDATSALAILGERVRANPGNDDSLKLHNSSWTGSCNSCTGNSMQALAGLAANSLSVKLLAADRLRGFSPFTGREKATVSRKNLTRTATPVRWCKFNLVGAVGIFVQFGVLLFLKSGLHFNYLAATVLAVEAAVVHNFFWHERFTWADRTKSERVRPALGRHPSGAKARSRPETLFRALKRCGTLKLRCAQNSCASENLAAAQSVFGASLRRFLRFDLTTGLISIGGNLGMMRVLVGRVHMNYLAANGIAIAVCSLLNFLVSDGWVFGEHKTLPPRICTDHPGFRDQN